MTSEVALVLLVLGVTIVLFVTEVLRVDVVAMLVMVTLPWLGLIEPEEAFLGLSRGAVVSIIAVVIMGHGLDRTGVTRLLVDPLLHIGKGSPRRLLAALLGSVGITSAFMQNVGAAALFLPVTVRIGRVASLSTSKLLMPLGFSAILGGTLTMIGSSPLIVLNDLVSAQGEERFGLFSVTPIGLTLLGAGVLLFAVLGWRILPDGSPESLTSPENVRRELLESWSLLDNLEQAMIPATSPLVGQTRLEASLAERFGVHVLALREIGRTVHAPSAESMFAPGQRLALHGAPEDLARLAAECGLRLRPHVRGFPEFIGSETAGFAEVLVSPRSALAGKRLREFGMRSVHGLEPVALLSGGERRAGGISDEVLKPGDLILVHGAWDRIRALHSNPDLLPLTDTGPVDIDSDKAWRAGLCFLAAITLALAGFSLPIALFSGALAMVLTRVMTADEAYTAVSWRTVFLLAGLIPLGVAMESSGAAQFLAEKMFSILHGAPTLSVMFTVALITTAFTLFMSNVAATVVLVPLVMDLGRLTSIDPRAMALLVGVCAQNSFLLPTHQVNALLMGPGGYRNADYLRAGGAMTLLFLPIATLGIYWVWL